MSSSSPLESPAEVEAVRETVAALVAARERVAMLAK